jgi:hypothetical protein
MTWLEKPKLWDTNVGEARADKPLANPHTKT